ncbi:MAG: leucine-rich repeat protein [Oscillospiraceae bacterium]|nr:leucine-rich repeat protein [Oscillospiraceae bacterium]
MKRILAIILILSIMLSLASCGCQDRNIGRLYTITFESNGGSTVPSQTVEARKTAQRPVAPTKEGFIFGGWHTDAALTQLYDFGKPVISDMTLYAKWEEKPVSGGGSSVDTYFISGLDIEKDNNLVTAVVSAPKNCLFLVRFIEEDIYFDDDYPNNKAYITSDSLYATCAVDAQTDMGKIGANIVGTLPEYYVAEAVLLDMDGNLLCNPASFIEHTTRYEDFAEKTVHDFAEDDVVLKFDKTEDMNFGVLADNVITLQVSDLVVDEETDLHTLKGASRTIKAGDKLFITDGTDTALIRVKSINKKDDIVEIIPANAEDSEYGFALEDFYKFLKVDMDYDGNVKSTNNPNSTKSADFGLKTTGIVDVNRTFSTALALKPLAFETEFFKASGKVDGEISANIIIIWDIVLFGEDEFRFEFTYDTDLTVNISVLAKIDNQKRAEKETKEVELGKVEIPFGITGLRTFAKVNGYVEWELEGGLEFNGTIHTEQGFKYSTKNGYQPVEKKSQNWTLQCKGAAKIDFGPKISVGVEFLDEVVTCELECFIGAKGECEIVVPVFQSGYSTEKHDCNLCIDGEVSGAISLHAKLKYKITEKLKGTPVDFKIAECEWKLFDLYISVLNPASSAFGGKFKMGLGSCPNKSYKTEFAVLDEENNPSNGTATVASLKNDIDVGAVRNGDYLYLPKGEYKATGNGLNASVTFTVNGNAQKVKIVKNSGDTVQDPSEKDYSAGLLFTKSSDGESYYVASVGICTDTEIVIPDTYNGLPVTGIREKAFYQNDTITSIRIPDSVITIEGDAIQECSALTDLYIGSGVQSVCEGNYNMVFNCPSLVNIEVSEDNMYFKTVDGNMMSKDGKTFVLYASGKRESSFAIPAGVTTIGMDAFAYAENLENVLIPDGVTEIQAYTFWNCTALESIRVPDGVTTIGRSAFGYTTVLRLVVLPESLNWIDFNAFSTESVNYIYYGGTVAQWQAISKDTGWDKHFVSYVIYCTDGSVSKS